MVGAGARDEGIEALTDPERSTDAGLATRGGSQDHEAGGGDMTEPAGEEFAMVEAAEHIVEEAFGIEQAREVIGSDACFAGDADGPAQVVASDFEVAALDPAQTSGDAAEQGFAGGAWERGVEGVDAVCEFGEFLDEEAAGGGYFAETGLRLEVGREVAGRFGIEAVLMGQKMDK